MQGYAAILCQPQEGATIQSLKPRRLAGTRKHGKLRLLKGAAQHLIVTMCFLSNCTRWPRCRPCILVTLLTICARSALVRRELHPCLYRGGCSARVKTQAVCEAASRARSELAASRVRSQQA